MADERLSPPVLPSAKEVDDEQICRYCFGGADEGDLISPCDCRGGQKFVHLQCLRRWQRMVLVSQPTHPALQSTTDERHDKCNVCNAKYTCPPPTRGDLMASFTGPEIAALVEEGCIIASRDSFSDYLLATQQSTIFFPRSSSHWIRGVYLITSVTSELEDQEISIDLQIILDGIRARITDDLCYWVHGRQYRLVSKGSLAGVASEDMASALQALRAPAKLVFTNVVAPSFSDDHIAAVNLTNPKPASTLHPLETMQVENAIRAVSRRYRGADRVELSHFNGGPCAASAIMVCIVLGGSGRGWTVKDSLEDAITLAYSRGARRCEQQGDIGGGQTMKIVNLRARTDLNGKRCLTLTFDQSSGRWAVSVGDTGESVKIKPINLEAVVDPRLPEPLQTSTGSYGRVLVFWGNAGWSRVQLLGEIAHGSWGLCRASSADLVTDFHERWAALSAPEVIRLAFAPVNEMTEDYVTNPVTPLDPAEQQAQLEAMRAMTNRLAAAYRDGSDDEEDSDEGEDSNEEEDSDEE